MDTLISWLSNDDNRWLLIAIVAVLLVLVILLRLFGLVGWFFKKAKRLGKPAALHPKLAAYAGHSEAEIEQDRRLAVGIVATSSTTQVAGYELTRQIEAVYVEGYRTPQEAANALKAAAARRGANAIINLTHQRTAAGKCSAQGDAVVIEPIVATQKRNNPIEK